MTEPERYSVAAINAAPSVEDEPRHMLDAVCILLEPMTRSRHLFGRRQDGGGWRTTTPIKRIDGHQVTTTSGRRYTVMSTLESYPEDLVTEALMALSAVLGRAVKTEDLQVFPLPPTSSGRH